MLYRELKSSQRSYMRNRSQTNGLETGTGTGTQAGNDTRRNKRYGNNSKYGRTSVVIMSSAGWRESQEALQDSDSTATKQSGSLTGITKREEVRVTHERLSTFSDENSIELKAMPQVHHTNRRPDDGGSSF